jgi:hypothetical protein
MRRPWQYTLLGAAIAFFVLYGIELTSDGMKEVYGPQEPRAQRAGAETGGRGYAVDPFPDGGRGAALPEDPYGSRPDDPYGGASRSDGAYGPDGADGRGGYDGMAGGVGYDGYGYNYGAGEGGGSAGRLADGTAGLLQSVAKGGIRFLVSLFEAVAH